MGKLKEDYEIVIKELNKASEVKDIMFSLNTSQSGVASFITQPINGELDAVIISSMEQVSIKISLEGYEDIVLFDYINFSGDKYLPLRLSGMVNTAEDIPNTGEKWILNGKLKFEISGGFNSKVNFVVRYR